MPAWERRRGDLNLENTKALLAFPIRAVGRVFGIQESALLGRMVLKRIKPEE